MRTLTDLAPTPARPDTLLVLLPGAETVLEDFERQGFIAAVRSRELALDIQLAEVGYEQVMAGTATQSLQDKVVRTARAAGYRHIWFAGISLGGFNALNYAAQHPLELAGICLLAPYAGTGDIIAEIRDAGGPLAWADTPLATQGHEREFWRWLVREARESYPGSPVYCQLGESDRFIKSQNMLATLLPAAHVRRLPGKHDWPAWQAQWADWLDHGPLARKRLQPDFCKDPA